jgi:Lsr2
MAQKITVALEDDLDGGPAEETVRFGLDGSEYEIDLSIKNATTFCRQLAPFVSATLEDEASVAVENGATVVWF